jgi:hypothetical protein
MVAGIIGLVVVVLMYAWTEAFAVSSSDTISRSSQGEISYCDASVKCSRCDSKNHQLTLTRR